LFAQRNLVQADPGPIIGPLSSFFGAILDFLYNIAYAITPTEAHTLGISIIFLTFAARILTFPLTFKSQKSMQAMQKLQPEMERIKKKYENQKDPDSQKKMGQEINKLYSENGANPIAGCVPIFIQFPIFMALFYIMNQPYRFIARLGVIYNQLAQNLIGIFDIGADGLAWNQEVFDLVRDISIPKIPGNMTLSLADYADLSKVLARFTPDDWDILMASLSPEALSLIQPLLESKVATEYFMGITLVANVGFSFPAILIPVACVAFTFFASYMSTKQQPKSDNPNQKMQQNMMLIVMPVMMGAITFGMPAGVGLYWATSSAIQIVQQHFTTKYFNRKKAETT